MSTMALAASTTVTARSASRRRSVGSGSAMRAISAVRTDAVCFRRTVARHQSQRRRPVRARPPRRLPQVLTLRRALRQKVALIGCVTHLKLKVFQNLQFGATVTNAVNGRAMRPSNASNPLLQPTIADRIPRVTTKPTVSRSNSAVSNDPGLDANISATATNASGSLRTSAAKA